jgi:hypothetical protein
VSYIVLQETIKGVVCVEGVESCSLGRDMSEMLKAKQENRHGKQRQSKLE